MKIIGMETATFYPTAGCALNAPSSKTPARSANEIISDRIIATSAKTAPDLLEALSRTATPAILELIAGNSNCAPSLLMRLAKHVSAQVRLAAAENKNIGEDILWQLVKDEDADVRYGLAENHHMPHQILKFLIEDENPYVACRAQQTVERLSEIRSMASESDSWKRFRASETRKRIMELVEESEQGPMAQVSRFFSNLYNYARAI